ncbi:membrane protein [Alicyclobacillus cellulosilyticus]|uniref:Membrane protein n=1 Tax=Alicyclobacillus cellulosilyticus TaxID=1003997 RepID=A0A917NIW3_9BACL|nr:putative sulfate exporter family transporter [Alicyclobacillus cellulosilyticus]GGJ03869.1 membrane protein [Alicyclobacillus cellulosilyticus]
MEGHTRPSWHATEKPTHAPVRVPGAAALGMAGGMAWTFAFAAAGIALAHLPGFARMGGMVCAILLAIAARQVVGYPERLRPGIQLVSQRGLRLAIVLYGLRLNLPTVLHQGLPLVAKGAVTIAIALSISALVGRWLGADRSLTWLLGVGTGVCGAAAVAAISPILGAAAEDTAIAVGMVALIGTVFSMAYTLVRPWLDLSAVAYGAWSGLSLHEIAHVAAAAAPAGSQAMAVALLAKLGRVLLLVPLSFAWLWWRRRQEAKRSAAPEAKDGPVPETEETSRSDPKGARGAALSSARVSFPWFLVGFVAMSVLGSLGWLGAPAVQAVEQASSDLLTAAMVGLGMNVHLRAIGQKALRPLLAMLAASLAVSLASLVSVRWI